MKHISLLLSIVIFIFLAISCKKESDNPEIRIAKIIKTSNLGSSTAATYSYNQNNQLVKIQHPVYDENFSYNQDGSLHKYDCSLQYAWIYTFHYNETLIDYTLIQYTGVAMSNQFDTVFFHYDSYNHLSLTDYRSSDNPVISEYKCDNLGNITRIVTIDDHDTTWLSWDDSGNLVQRIDKSRNYETGGYNSYTYDYQYDNGLNFLSAAHYPEEYLFIRSLQPSPSQSKSNCLTSGFFHFTWPMESGEITITGYNEQNYPIGMKFSNSENTYELVYEN